MEVDTISVPLKEWEELKKRVGNLERKVAALPYDTEYMSIPEACGMLGVSRTTLWRYRNEGLIRTHAMAGKMVVNRAELLDAVNSGRL